MRFDRSTRSGGVTDTSGKTRCKTQSNAARHAHWPISLLVHHQRSFPERTSSPTHKSDKFTATSLQRLTPRAPLIPFLGENRISKAIDYLRTSVKQTLAPSPATQHLPLPTNRARRKGHGNERKQVKTIIDTPNLVHCQLISLDFWDEKTNKVWVFCYLKINAILT